ncbi:NAD-dependent epimerase [Cobetia amphilecti]|uniref:D-erythronate dehydrogenase n=1 Tax=Cobetia amphilecti TaxID=1055104 RepID=UPI00050121E6|nr:D-erythronate dehydrogenase [Cobetia amphilecti]KGA01129.1 NAD-dependent epimerase [Cobetia amphilecti]
MHVMITGAAGFLGQRLTEALIDKGSLKGQPLSRVTLLDQIEAPRPEAASAATSLDIEIVAGDIADAEVLDRCLAGEPQVIYHLAAVVSSAAEADLELGMRVNFDATRLLLEGCAARRLNGTRLVMASSVAAYGGDLPETLSDMTALVPQNSYGTQKAMSELLINDYSRRGLVDGCVLRLPTIIVRPGRPNAAASSFASSILREPLNGEDAICPVPTDLEMFVMSPRRVVAALIKGAEVHSTEFGLSRCFMLPGITVSVAQMLQALKDIAGQQALDLVRHEPDARITAIVGSWPARFDSRKANSLGFVGDADLHEIINAYRDESAIA